MTQHVIQEWTRRQPFEPFVLRLSNGISHEIRHPDMVIPTRTKLHIGVLDPQNAEIERVVHVSLLHVVQIEPMEHSAAGQ
jgi:hypothetical protein